MVDATIPEASLHGLDPELRSLIHALASYAARFDHLAEMSSRHAEEVTKLALV